MKKMSRRSKTKYPGLDKSVTLKVRHELLDQDYLHELNDTDKTWLSNFMREWASADLKHPGKKFHRTRKERKLINDANNARNRDSFAVTKSNGMLKGMKSSNKENSQTNDVGFSGSRSTLPNETEDVMIAVLDDFNEQKILLAEELQKKPQRKKRRRQ